MVSIQWPSTAERSGRQSVGEQFTEHGAVGIDAGLASNQSNHTWMRVGISVKTREKKPTAE